MVHYESPFPPLPALPTINVSNFFLHQRPVDAPDFVFQIDADNGQTRTWNAFKAHVGGISAALTAPSQEGALALDRTRDIVGVLGAPSSDYVALMHACWATTVPFCPLSAFAPAPELAQLLADASVTVLFVDAIYLSTALAAAKEAGLSDKRIYILEGNAPGRLSLNELVRRVADRGVKPPPVHPVDERTLAYLLFSSGTSGRPKAVAVSHANILANMTQWGVFMQTVAASGPPPPPDMIPVWLNFMPLHHTYVRGL
jgi:acyl-CoA synthetase (AMP-forming)/AMP-acid ligase II